MLSSLKSLFEDLLPDCPVSEDTDDLKRMASAALMIEVAMADDHFDDSEMAMLKEELQRQLSLSEQTVNGLVDSARQQQKAATSLFQFTQQINQCFEPSEKMELMVGLWKIAYADDNLDKYEEHLIRRIAELIHLPHTQFIKAKLLASSHSV